MRYKVLMDFEWIRKQILSGQYLWSLHADEERRHDGLEIVAVENAILEGEILEKYVPDLRGDSCLVFGESQGVSIHIVCGKNKKEQLVIVTVYKPGLPKWKTPRERTKK